MSICKFCEDYEFKKVLNKELNQQEKDPERRMKTEFTAALVEKCWTKRTPKGGAGKYTRGGYKLNYCPECGKELKKTKGTKP